MGVAEQSVTAEGRRAKHPPVPGQGRPRRRRPGSVLAPMLVAALLAGLAAYMVLRDQDATYRVAVAATELRPGAPVSADSFRLVDTKVPRRDGRLHARAGLGGPAPGGQQTLLEQLDRHLLAAWLNLANGAIGLDELIDTTGDDVGDTPLLDVLNAAEAARLDPTTAKAELEAWKDLLENINRSRA